MAMVMVMVMATLQHHRQGARTPLFTNPLVINAACARFVVIVRNLNVPIAEKPRLPAASPIRVNGSTIPRSCESSINAFALLAVLGDVRHD